MFSKTSANNKKADETMIDGWTNTNEQRQITCNREAIKILGGDSTCVGLG